MQTELDKAMREAWHNARVLRTQKCEGITRRWIRNTYGPGVNAGPFCALYYSGADIPLKNDYIALDQDMQKRLRGIGL